MEHESHISEKSDLSVSARVIAFLVMLAVVLGVGGYFVYGSGLWNPQTHHSDQ